MSCYERIKGLGESYASLETIIAEFIIGSMGIKNLANLIANGQESKILARLSLMDRTKHVQNTLLLDAEETYTRNAAATTGLEKLVDKLVLGISCATGIPVTVLMGESPAGLNATGDNDLRRYYDKIQGMQHSMLNDPLTKLVRYLILAKNSKLRGIDVDEFVIEYPTLWALTDSEEAKRRKDQADADAIYYDRNILSAGEIAQSRFGGDSYTVETALTAKRDSDGNLSTPNTPVNAGGNNLIEPTRSIDKNLEMHSQDSNKGTSK
jgi:phage-related protein (TIGR01555 family)